MANLSAPGEQLVHILNKLSYIEKEGMEINNALLILDKKIIKNLDGKSLHGVIYLHHSISTGESYMATLMDGFSYYTNSWFFVKYLAKLAGVSTKSNSNIKLNGTIVSGYQRDLEVDYYFKKDKEIDSIGPLHKEKACFKEVEKSNWSPTLSKRDCENLIEISKLFKRNGTKFKIIFGPYYLENGLSEKVIGSFNEIFDKKNIYDYSHAKKFKSVAGYWYDGEHYRKQVADEILSKVYGKK